MDRDFCLDETENAAEKCHLCSGDGFIYITVIPTPCPHCWGSGEEDVEEDYDEG